MVLTDKYVLFWGGEFSNFFPAKFVFEKRIFYCSEQFFMWKKALFFHDYKIASKIYNEGKEPKIAKKLGRQVNNFDEEKWAEVRYEIMYQAIYLKFSQNKELKEKLLSYGDRTFAEASPYDRIWGIGLSEDDPLATDSNNWLGTNLLGRALCMLRDFFNAVENIKENNSNKQLIEAIDTIGIDTIVNSYNNDEILENIKVEDAVRYYGISEVLDCFSKYEIVNECGESSLLDEIDASDIVIFYDNKELLDEMSPDTISEYLKSIYFYDDDISYESGMKDMIVNLCRTVKPRGDLNKNDMKKILTDYIDEHFYS